MGIKRRLIELAKAYIGHAGYEIRRVRPTEKESDSSQGALEALRARMKPRVTLQQLMDHISELSFEPSSVIDVGVGAGTDWLDPYFVKARRLYVEPLVEFEDSIKQKCQSTSSNYVIAAAGAEAGEFTVSFDPDHLTNASLLPDGGVERHVSRAVPVVTLDSLLLRFQMEGPVLLKIDVQGGELEVLKGANNVLELTEFAVLEVTLFEVRKGWPLFDEVLTFMGKRGFIVYDILGGSNRPLDGARFQFDIAFVKHLGFFRKSDLWATTEQIALLRGR